MHPFEDVFLIGGVHLDVAPGLGVDFLQHPAGRVVDLQPDVGGHDRAAVGDRRVGDGHLQRVGLEVALAGGQLDVVAGRPRPFGFAFLVELVPPLLGGEQPFGGARQVDAGRPPDPELVRPVLEVAGVPHPQPERVEEDVG